MPNWSHTSQSDVVEEFVTKIYHFSPSFVNKGHVVPELYMYKINIAIFNALCSKAL